MARNDDDDRPRKRRARDEDIEDDDRPRKRRARDEEDDDEEEDDRPRKRRARDEEDDDEEEDDRPRKRRSRDEEDDEEEDDDRPSKKKKKKKKPMPGMLLAVSIVNMVWGGLASLYGLYNFLSSVSALLTILNAQQMFNVGVFGLTRGFMISVTVIYFLILIASIGTLGGGIALILRKGFGKYLVLGSPIGKVLFCLIGTVVAIIFLRGTLFLMGYIFAYVVMLVFDLGLTIFNFIALANTNVKKALD